MVLAAPTFGSLARSLYPTYIADGKGKETLPCDIMELNYSQSNDTPRTPIDDNTYIADTIYRNPYSLRVKVFVSENEFEKFQKTIAKFQKQDGFIVKGISSLYRNLRYVTHTHSETPDICGAYHIEIEFSEVILVKAKKKAFDKSTSKNPSDEKSTDSGQAKGSILYGFAF